MVDDDEARRTLGVVADASPDAIRAAFRRLVLRGHPDHAGTAGHAPTARLIEAYHVLRAAGDEPVQAVVPPPPAAARPAPPPPAPAPSEGVVRAVGDIVVVARPAPEVWRLLLEAADELGEIAYVDRSAALVEIVVCFVDWPVSSVVCSVRGGWSRTEIGCSVAALGAGEGPPADGVARLLGERLRPLVAAS